MKKRAEKDSTGTMPRFAEARDILERYRSASTDREKLKVLNSIKQKYPQIAERMALLLS